MNERGRYGGVPLRIGSIAVSGDGSGSSWGKSIVIGLLVGGAVLWAKNQSDQIKRLSAATGLPHHGFVEDLAAQTKALAGSARAKIHKLSAKKET
jgi:hypothetical protein